MMQINYTKDIVGKFDAILARGLCAGVGSRDGQMCVEAAICAVLNMPHGDNPTCVTPAVRGYKIRLNDSEHWGSPTTRAEGLRALGLAQIGSAGVVDGVAFTARLAEKTIRVLLPDLFRRFTDHPGMLAAADRCEREGTRAAAAAAYAAAYAANANANAAAAAAACFVGVSQEYYLRLSAKLALEVLIELKSPGVAFLSL